MTSVQALAIWMCVIMCGHVALQIGVIRARRRERVGLGDGGNARVLRATRIHGNYLEQVPFTFAGFGLMTFAQTPPLFMHAIGLLFIAARLAHARGLAGTSGVSRGRVAGVVGTWAVFALAYGIALVRLFLPA